MCKFFFFLYKTKNSKTHIQRICALRFNAAIVWGWLEVVGGERRITIDDEIRLPNFR